MGNPTSQYIGRTSFACLRKRDSIPSHTAERVQNRSTPAPICNLVRDQLWGDAVPSFLIQEATLGVQGEISIPLGKVYLYLSY